MFAAFGLGDTAALGLVRHLIDFAVKGSALVILAWAASIILRGSSASVRHLLWSLDRHRPDHAADSVRRSFLPSS